MRRYRVQKPLVVGLALLSALGLVCLLFLSGCSQGVDPWDGEKGSPRVVVTIPPLYSFVRAVGGDRVGIRCLCTTTGVHHYQTNSRDARLFEKADIAFVVGLRLDETFSDSLRVLARRSDLPMIRLGELLPKENRLELKHGPAHAGHNHGTWDPHVWLGISPVKLMVASIRDKLSEIDQAHADEYSKNAEAFLLRLDKLHKEGQAALKDKKVKRIVSFHEALGYFAKSYGLEIADVIEVSPGDEPTPGQLSRIVELCLSKEKPVGAIAVEPQYPRTSSASTIQQELHSKGVKIGLVEVDTLETANPSELQSQGATWYEQRLRNNIEALAGSLK